MKNPKRFWEDLDRQREMFSPVTTEGFTMKEYCKRYSISINQARGELGKLLNSGRIQFVGIRPPCGQGARQKAYIIK